MTKILALDPGTRESAWLLLDCGQPVKWAKEPNPLVRWLLHDWQSKSQTTLVIESMVNYGVNVGDDVFEAVRWIGRFEEVWAAGEEGVVKYVKRATVKAHLCGSSSVKDSDVRAALIHRWGGEDAAIGGAKCKACKGRGSVKKQPCQLCGGLGQLTPKGPLHGLAGDCWSALAIATTWHDEQQAALAATGRTYL